MTGFAIVGVAVAFTMGSLGELAAAFPVAGSFYDYSVRFIAPSWGFSMGWNYIINFLLIVPFEITVMTMIAQYWNTSLHPGILVPILITCLFIIASAGAKWYGEAEHAFGILKVTMLVAFSLTAIVIASGGVSTDPRHGTGFQYWQDGGAFRGGASGFLWVFVAAGMAYGGTEMLGLTVAECEHPQKVMPLAFKIVGIRIFVCYITPLFMAGLVLGPATFEAFKDLPTSSPFVLAIRGANIRVLPDIFNGVILVAVFSMANASIFASSRALRAICDRGMGPRIFARTTKNGLPLNALAVVFVVSLIAFINCAPSGRDIFEWLLASASASQYFTWMSINIAHIRLRLAIKKQGRDLNAVLNWKSPLGIYGSMFAILVSNVGLVALLVSAAVPPAGLHSESAVASGIKNAMGFFIVIGLWLGHMVFTWRDAEFSLLIPLNDIDLSQNGTIASEHHSDVEVQRPDGDIDAK
jgi:amino acid transporter